MKIGYFITACNEYDELAKLLVLLRTNILKTDCIGILLDEDNCTEEVRGLCNQFLIPNDSAFRVIYGNLNKDFASFKNLGYHLFEDCDWIFNIDADELPSSILLKNIHQIIDVNPETELTKIKKLAKAAMVIGFSHFKWFRIGAKNIPPPMPTRPDSNPITPPNR